MAMSGAAAAAVAGGAVRANVFDVALGQRRGRRRMEENKNKKRAKTRILRRRRRGGGDRFCARPPVDVFTRLVRTAAHRTFARRRTVATATTARPVARRNNIFY